VSYAVRRYIVHLSCCAALLLAVACKSATTNAALARAHLEELAGQIEKLPPAERAKAQKSLAAVAQVVTDLDNAYQRAQASAQTNQSAADKYRTVRAIAITAALVAVWIAAKRFLF
jgi:purine-cytosine permease-like protein